MPKDDISPDDNVRCYEERNRIPLARGIKYCNISEGWKYGLVKIMADESKFYIEVFGIPLGDQDKCYKSKLRVCKFILCLTENEINEFHNRIFGQFHGKVYFET